MSGAPYAGGAGTICCGAAGALLRAAMARKKLTTTRPGRMNALKKMKYSPPSKMNPR